MPNTAPARQGNESSWLADLEQSIDTQLETIDHELLAADDFAAANAARSWSQQLSKLSVLVPVYNERWTIEQLLRDVLSSEIDLELEIIVVDDGSTDGTAEAVENFIEADDPITLIRHDQNLGKGSAVRTAIKHMSGDVAIIQDGDLEYSPAEYSRLLQPILDGNADAVYGSRYAGPERRVLLFWHSLGNRILTLLCNVLNDLNLTDMETCYKVFRRDIIQSIDIKENRFGFEPEVVAKRECLQYVDATNAVHRARQRKLYHPNPMPSVSIPKAVDIHSGLVDCNPHPNHIQQCIFQPEVLRHDEGESIDPPSTMSRL